MDAGEIAAIVIACVVAPIGVVLLVDIARVFAMVRYYHEPKADPERVAEYQKRMEDAYTGRATEGDGNPFAHVVTDAEFEASIAEFEKAMDAKGAGENGSIFSSL